MARRSYVNRLHALDLATGAEKFGGPNPDPGNVPGNGGDSVNGTISFNNITENQRPALAARRTASCTSASRTTATTRPTTAG